MLTTLQIYIRLTLPQAKRREKFRHVPDADLVSPRPNTGEASSSTQQSATGDGCDTYIHGITAAVRAVGNRTLDVFVDTTNDKEIDQFRKLQMKWVVDGNLFLNVFDKDAWKQLLQFLRPALLKYSLNYNLIDRFQLEDMFMVIKEAVETFISKQKCVFTVPDGWEDQHKNHLINIVEVAGGIPFFRSQSTPQGEREGAAFYMEMCKDSLARPNNYGLVGDNPTVMNCVKTKVKQQPGPGGVLKMAANCHFHGIDTGFGHLRGITTENGPAAEFKIPALAEACNFSAYCVNFFKNRH